MTTDYILGHSASERQRLMQQGGLLAEFTADVLRQAGIEQGMRVLDIGCGMGDVLLLVARMVGDSGEVIGVDQNADVLNEATRRAMLAGASHVRFVNQRIDELNLPADF